MPCEYFDKDIWEEEVKGDEGEKIEKVELEENTDEVDEDEVPAWMWDESSSQLPENVLSLTEEKVVVRLYNLARDLSSILERHNITFWTSGGSTLGIVRHGGLIPWDDDLDICIRDQDEEKLSSVVPELAKAGYLLSRAQSYSWKVSHLIESEEVRTKTGRVENYRFPFCDVFIMRRRKNRWELRNKEGRSAWPEEWYSMHQVDKIQLRQFADFLLPCPGDPEDYLDRTYGESWPEVGATHFFSHKSASILRSTVFSIAESATFLPAQPFH